VAQDPSESRSRKFWPGGLTTVRAVVVAVILIAGLVNLCSQLGTQPPPHATDDEYWYSWTGLALIHGQQPTSWSLLSGYKKRNLGYGYLWNTKYYFVRPAMDHPPLFSVLAGVAASLAGTQPMHIQLYPSGGVDLWEINLARMRVVPVLLFVGSFFLLLDIALLSVGFWPACAALLMFSFSRHMVFHHRLLVADNLVTPLLLANVAVTQRYLMGLCGRRAFAVATLVCVPCAVLSKLVAISAAAAVSAMLLVKRRWRDLLIPAGAVVLGLALVALYAVAVDWDMFRTVQRSQAGRFSGFNAIERLVGLIQVIDHNDFSQLICIGWVFAFAMALDRSAPPVAVAIVGYFLAFTFFADSRNVYGWHQAAFYPLLCLAVAWFVRKAVRARSVAITMVVMGLLLTWMMQEFWSMVPVFPRFDRFGYFAVVVLLLGVTQIGDVVRRRQALRLYAGAIVLIGLACETERARVFPRENWIEMHKSRRPGGEKTAPGFM
jgi:hypothetical protein